MIEVKNLTKYYGSKLGVEDVSFTIEKGEIVGLLGPNGAGKSTIMKMINGYFPPTSGTITVGGYDVVENPREAAACIGFLPEIPPLYVEMPVEDFLMFIAKIRGVPRAERKEHVNHIMELANITHVRERLIKNLSKGYRQRVGLAQALVNLPEILILDEPTVGLDPKQITEVRDLIKELSKEHTVILSSHILSEVNAICEKIIIINRGHLVTVDSVEHLERGTGRSTLLRVKADRQRVLDVLGGCESIESVQVLPAQPGDGESVRFSVLAAKDGGVAEELFRLCAEKDMPILEMRPLDASLEEVFLTLTADTAAEQGTGEEKEDA
jgi:ABC-2 type transport system ATP-binding protein